MQQGSLIFESPSPVNTSRLSGQNLRLFQYLEKGNKIHCFSEAKKELRIGFLNSRISDLSNKHNITIYKRGKKVVDFFGELVDVVEYSMYPFENKNN